MIQRADQNRHIAVPALCEVSLHQDHPCRQPRQPEDGNRLSGRAVQPDDTCRDRSIRANDRGRVCVFGVAGVLDDKLERAWAGPRKWLGSGIERCSHSQRRGNAQRGRGGVLRGGVGLGGRHAHQVQISLRREIHGTGGDRHDRRSSRVQRYLVHRQAGRERGGPSQLQVVGVCWVPELVTVSWKPLPGTPDGGLSLTETPLRDDHKRARRRGRGRRITRRSCRDCEWIRSRRRPRRDRSD